MLLLLGVLLNMLHLHILFGQILYDANDIVIGIGTNDMGVGKDGSKKETYQQGVELRGHYLSSLYLSVALVRKQ